MPLDLTGVRAKLAWSRHHFEIVDGEIDTWMKRNPYQIIFQRNDEFTKFWLRLKITDNTADFQRWGLILGDCVTNMRDALDHLIFAIAGLITSPNPDKAERAAFVIASDSGEFKKWSRGKLASVPDSVRDSILTFQPFNRRSNPRLPSLLGILAELANGNKHKVITVALTTPSMIDVELTGIYGISQEPTLDIYRGNLKDGDPVCIFEVPKPDPHLKLKADSKVGLHIAIRHMKIEGNKAFDADRTAYRQLILALFEEVEIVIDTLTKLV
jgi:hypothetical protein